MSNSIESPVLLTKQEVAKRLRKTTRSVNEYMRTRRISYLKIGKTVRFTPEAVEQFLKAHTVHAVQ